MNDVLLKDMLEAALGQGEATAGEETVEVTLESTLASEIRSLALRELVSHSAMTAYKIGHGGVVARSDITEEAQMQPSLAVNAEAQQVAGFYASRLSMANIPGFDQVMATPRDNAIEIAAIFRELPVAYRKAIFRVHSDAVLGHPDMRLRFAVVELCGDDLSDLVDITPATVVARA